MGGEAKKWDWRRGEEMGWDRRGWTGGEGRGKGGNERERRVPKVTPSKNPRSATGSICARNPRWLTNYPKY